MRSKSKGIIIGFVSIAVAIAVAIVIVAVFLKRDAEESPLKIGVLLPLTGEAASYGKDCQKGIQIALDEVRQEQGRSIQMFYEDTKADPKNAVAAFNKLRNVDKVTAVIGDMFSSTTLAIAPIAQQSQITLLTPTAADERIPATGDYIFSIYPLATFEGNFLANHLEESVIERVAVFYQNQQATKSIADSFAAAVKKRGGDIVSFESLPDDKSIYRSLIKKVAEKKPSSVFISAYRDEVALIIITGRELGVNVQYISQSTLYDEKALEDYANKLEGVLVSGPFFDSNSSDPRTAAFSNKYSIKYGQPPSVWAAYGYDAANLLIAACSEALLAGGSPKDRLKGRTFEGLTGKTTFRSDRSVEKQMNLFEIRNNKFVRK